MELGEVFSIQYYHGYILQLFAAELLFLPVLKRRDHFYPRLILSFLLYGLLSIVLTNLIIKVAVGLSSITIFVLSLPMGVFCYKNKFKDILFCCVGAQLIQNTSHNLEMLIYLPLREYFSSVGWFFLSFVVMIIVYVIAYLVIISKMRQSEEINIPGLGTFLIALLSALFCYFIQFMLQVYEIDTYWVTKLPLLLCDLLALVVSFGLISYRDSKEENMELERYISQSNKNYELVKANIDLLNLKAHDLKHFISSTRAMTDMDDEGLRELQKTIEDYEAMAKTGNKTLDYILTDKGYLCKKKGISFTFSVDGHSLSFMKSSDLVSLFGNLLSNAIEAEDKLDNHNQSYILLKVAEKGKMVSIHIENYYKEKILFQDGLPKTSKENAKEHGFGLKSVKYIVKKYQGILTIAQENNVYEVNILFPRQEKE